MLESLACTKSQAACNALYWLQIVVLAGGTNDFHATAPPLEEWTNDIISFIDMVNPAPLYDFFAPPPSTL